VTVERPTLKQAQPGWHLTIREEVLMRVKCTVEISMSTKEAEVLSAAVGNYIELVKLSLGSESPVEYSFGEIPLAYSDPRKELLAAMDISKALKGESI
jgi:hypothetical protein